MNDDPYTASHVPQTRKTRRGGNQRRRQLQTAWYSARHPSTK